MNNNQELDSIEVVQLPPEKWMVYRDIRLVGLREEPQAFLRSGAEELLFKPEKWIERVKNKYTLVAMLGSEPVGTASAFISQEDDNKVANIVGVYVSSPYRSKGVGSRLIYSLIKKLSEDTEINQYKLSVNTQQAAAIQLYEKYGFVKVGEKSAVMGDGKEHKEYVMVREISN